MKYNNSFLQTGQLAYHFIHHSLQLPFLRNAGELNRIWERIQVPATGHNTNSIVAKYCNGCATRNCSRELRSLRLLRSGETDTGLPSRHRLWRVHTIVQSHVTTTVGTDAINCLCLTVTQSWVILSCCYVPLVNNSSNSLLSKNRKNINLYNSRYWFTSNLAQTFIYLWYLG